MKKRKYVRIYLKQDDGSIIAQPIPRRSKPKNAPWDQLFEIHFGFECKDGSYKLVMGYTALIPDSKQETYEMVFQFMKDHCQKYNIKFNNDLIILCDYEINIRKAIKKIFGYDVKGELFHFTKALFKNLVDHSLHLLYFNYDKLRICVRYLFCLSLIPIDYVILCYNKFIKRLFQKVADELEKTYGNVKLAVQNYLEYFENTWFKRYKVEQWNLFLSNIRTTNLLEGWHNKLNSKCNNHHLNCCQIYNSHKIHLINILNYCHEW